MESLLEVGATPSPTLYLNFSNRTYVALHCGRCVTGPESVFLPNDMNYGNAMPMTPTGIRGPANKIHSRSARFISLIPDGSHFRKLVVCEFSGKVGFRSAMFRSGSSRRRYENRTAIHRPGGQRMTGHRFHEACARKSEIRHCFARARTATAGSIRSCRPEHPIQQSMSNLSRHRFGLPAAPALCGAATECAGSCRCLSALAGPRRHVCFPWLAEEAGIRRGR